MGAIRGHSTLPMQFPGSFKNATIELHGPAGAAWLKRLPYILKQCEVRWSLKLESPFPNLTYNYAAPAKGPAGTRWVLKAGYPNPELTAEIEALRRFDGQGAVQLIKADPDLGLILLEELVPGIPLINLEDDSQAASIAAGLMVQLRQPVPNPHHFRTVADWFRGLKRLRTHFQGGSGPFPPELVERAESVSGELLASSVADVLLHGDLHHTNILAAQRQPWLAIDPKGVVGEPAYEPSAFMHNPIPHLMQSRYLKDILHRRADQFSKELELDRSRLAGWAFAQAVLSAWWAYEDHGHGWEYFIACAEVLKGIA